MPNRCNILEAAGRVYAKFGFRGATTRLIAIEAGVNEVTLFRTFGSKGALIEAVLKENGAQHAHIPLPSSPTDPASELTAWVQAGLDRLRELRPLILHAMSEREERPEADSFACQGREHAHDVLMAYATALTKAGLADANADIHTATVMLISSVMGDVMARPMVPNAFPSLEEAAARYVNCFLRAIGSATTATQELRPRAATSRRPSARSA